MCAEKNSVNYGASPSGKGQSHGTRRQQKKSVPAKTAASKILLFGRLRELALYRAEFLRERGFRVVTPRDRAEAIKAIESEELAAAILSYTLSTEVVEELAELVKQSCPACPLIVISQSGRVDRRIGPDEVVIADEGPAALLKAVWRALGNRLQ